MPDIYTHIPQNTEPPYEIVHKVFSPEEHLILERFEMPSVAADLLDFFFTEEDRKLILSYEKGTDIPKDALRKDYREDAFHRGVISKVDESGEVYHYNTFYTLLDVFCVSQTRKYRSLPKEKRRELDDWYFQSYIDSLDQDLTRRPTSDKVVTYQEMLDFLENMDASGHSFYLSPCDCKSLRGDCGAPDRTCINYSPGINSYVARGISQKLTLEEAKDVISRSEKEGVVHTISDHGICNCCEDCCYLFRGQKVRESVGFWPESPHVIAMDHEKCISCGKCTKRCRFQVFEKIGTGKEAVIKMDATRCIGCELCANACPAKALKLIDRPADLIQINGVRGTEIESRGEDHEL